MMIERVRVTLSTNSLNLCFLLFIYIHSNRKHLFYEYKSSELGTILNGANYSSPNMTLQVLIKETSTDSSSLSIDSTIFIAVFLYYYEVILELF